MLPCIIILVQMLPVEFHKVESLFNQFPGSSPKSWEVKVHIGFFLKRVLVLDVALWDH